MIKNTYIDIAENDLQYLESVLETGSTVNKLKNLEQVLATHDFSEEMPLGEILNSLEDDAHE